MRTWGGAALRSCDTSRASACQIWDWRGSEPIKSFALGTRVHGLALDGERLAVATADTSVYVYDLATWDVQVLARHRRSVKAVTLSEGRAYTASYDQTIKVWVL